MDTSKIENLAKLIRYFILLSTTEAGSGHPTSSLSATDLMTVLFFGGFFRFKLDDHGFANNDRLIFSKGHASPLFYSLYAAAGAVSEDELKTLRKFDSNLEGHPTMRFPFTEAATGSLGQGLSIGVGMAMNAKFVDKLPCKTYVLLGDSEMAEGSMYEAMEIAAFYKLDNLVAILDANRLGQRGETMYGHNIDSYAKKAQAFGWETFVIDGHNLEEIQKSFESALAVKEKPVMIVAKTFKGKGISFLEDKDGWHGKAVSKEEFEKVLGELGEFDKSLRGELVKPEDSTLTPTLSLQGRGSNEESVSLISYTKDEKVATRKAYGNALKRIYSKYPNMVVLDAEVSNSTFSEIFKKDHPERFFEMYIAEQNMVGTALGFSRRGKIPFISTFAAFFSRAFDQIRMSQYSDGNIKFVGSHVGVSIGEDGSSQMGLEDIAMFRTLQNSVVFYPSDAMSTERVVELAAEHHGNVYIRTTRAETPVLYTADEKFQIGGSKLHESTVKSKDSRILIVGAGITLYEALKAQDELAKENIEAVVMDAYSVKPIDDEILKQFVDDTKAIITVEDHFPEGGLGEAVRDALSGTGARIYSLAVRKMPRSGKPAELLSYEEIDSQAIIKKVKELVG